ncbi:MAG TPA: AarF/UbiB family protein [Gemmatimonadaceae bacterium]|nr:AarF/UbiB family protein [Gemmatimonadaceae bacterium]
MELSFKPSHIKRYRDIAKLVMKYARTDMLKDPEMGLLAAPEDGDDEHKRLRAGDGKQPPGEELAADLERMGPTFIKFGQLLASRAELLPPDYVSALERLQDDVKPFPFEDVERIVTEELGVRISKAFAQFAEEPVAAASLGQAHRATLRDGRKGRPAEGRQPHHGRPRDRRHDRERYDDDAHPERLHDPRLPVAGDDPLRDGRGLGRDPVVQHVHQGLAVLAQIEEGD